MPEMAQDGTRQGVPNPPRGRLTGARAPQRGQILATAAIVLTAMIGVLGLAIDLGYTFSQRRNSQNAADAGALAGAQAVSKGIVAGPKVTSTVNSNAMGNTGAAPTVKYCIYVGDAYVDPAADHTHTSNCDGSPPTGTSGVHVHVEETHDTFFMPVLGIDTATTSAKATARVQIFANPPTDGPFLVCGINTKVDPSGTTSILIKDASGNWITNPAAVGKTYKIHGPTVADCDAEAGRFKGIADNAKNRNLTVPGFFYYTEGTVAGQIETNVLGVDGCEVGQEVNNCVAFLPVIVNDPKETNNDRRVWVVKLLPFYVTKPKANEHNAQLLPDYVVIGKGDDGWNPNYEGTIVVRMTE